MALLWMDGFDHYKDNDTDAVYDHVRGAYSLSGTEGSFFGWQITTFNTDLGFTASGNTSSAGNGWQRLLADEYQSGSLGVGFHFKCDSTALENLGGSIVDFVDTSGTSLFSVWKGTAGALQLRNGNNNGAGTLLATSATSIVAGTIYHIETKITIAASGNIEVRLNGQTVIDWDGDTNNWPIDRIGFNIRHGFSTNGVMQWDNLYIYDGTGSVNNDWLGERSVITIFPDADTATADWTKSTGSDGFDLINDAPPVDDTNYIEASTAADQSIFGMESLPSSSVFPVGIMTVVRAQKDSAGDAQIQFGPRHDATSDLSDATVLTEDQFLYYGHISEINPSTSAAWTVSDLNELELDIVKAV